MFSCEKVIQLDSNYPYVWRHKGVALQNLGDFKSSLEWLITY